MITTASTPAIFRAFVFSFFSSRDLALRCSENDFSSSPSPSQPKPSSHAPFAIALTSFATDHAPLSGSNSTHRVGSSTGSSSGRHSVTCPGANKAHCTPVALESRSFESVMKYVWHGRVTLGVFCTKDTKHT